MQQWLDLKSNYSLLFHVSCTDLLQYISDSKSITIFYGFLDQDTAKLNAVEYIQAQIEEKGAAGLNQCYGSFIVAHYNYISQKFILANDAMGDFSLHYTAQDATVCVSDTPQALLLSKDNVVNKKRLFHYFALSQPQTNASFFEHINQLNPGQYINLTGNQLKVNSYYTPATKVDYQLNDEEQLSQKFKSLLQTVIKHQTQGEKHVGVMMSGGMDSTFVVANCLQTNKRVSTFSYVFPNMLEANESIWIDSMRVNEMDMNTFVGENQWPLKPPWPISSHSPIGNPYRGLKSIIYQQVRNKNIKILLSGVFADHLYTGYIYHIVDQLKHKPFAALKSLYTIMLSDGIKVMLKQIAPAKWTNKVKTSAPWLTKQAEQQLKLNNEQYIAIKHPHAGQYALSYGIATAQSSYLDHEYAFEHNIFVRHPFRDRRIVEFLMSLPAWILGDINNPKKFVKKAARNLLPDIITRRKAITSLKPLFVKGVLDKELKRVKGLLNREESSWHQFVKKERIQAMLNSPDGDYKDTDYMILWQCISYEIWISNKRIKLT